MEKPNQKCVTVFLWVLNTESVDRDLIAQLTITYQSYVKYNFKDYPLSPVYLLKFMMDILKNSYIQYPPEKYKNIEAKYKQYFKIWSCQFCFVNLVILEELCGHQCVDDLKVTRSDGTRRHRCLHIVYNTCIFSKWVYLEGCKQAWRGTTFSDLFSYTSCIWKYFLSTTNLGTEGLIFDINVDRYTLEWRTRSRPKT